MSTHNIGFYEEIAKLSLNYHQIRTIFLLLSKVCMSPVCGVSYQVQHKHGCSDTENGIRLEILI